MGVGVRFANSSGSHCLTSLCGGIPRARLMIMIGGNLGTLWIWHSMRARDDREIGASGYQSGKGTLESEFGT